jgi:hypothetical protein
MENAKRLRSVQIEMEKMKGTKRTLEKGQDSRLATALLSLWAHGKISAITCRWLAECASLDGCTHPEINDIAKMGCHGKYPGNVHRDLLTRFVKDVSVPEPLQVPVRCLNPKTLQKGEEEAAIFLPHMVFSKLANLPNFNQLFPTSMLEQFWHTLERNGDPGLPGHPMRTQNWRRFTIPLFVHGDGVQYANNNSLMVWSWGALMTCFNSLQSKYLICCWPKSATSEKTWEDLLEVICWSFCALQKGYHPSHDHTGAPLKKGSPFYEKKGQPLANGYRGCIWAIMGDAEFAANCLGLPHWASTHPCAECDATSNQEHLAKWFKNIEIDTQEFERVSYAEALANPCSSNPLFHSIPGLSTKFVRGDALHIAFVHGVHSHVMGSVLHYICYFNGPGRQATPPQERLSVIWQAVQKAYKDLNSSTRLSNLRLSMFTNPKEPHSSYPTLSIKGSEAKHLLPALLVVCKSLLKPDIFHERCMLDCMEHLQKVVDLYSEADIVLTEQEWEKVYTLGKGFLDIYSLLNGWAEEQERLLFHKVWKFHSFQHMVENSKWLNPRCHWCFSQEDFVGKISLLTYSISSGVSATKLSQKLSPKYRVLLHLLLTRDNFQQTTRELADDDP